MSSNIWTNIVSQGLEFESDVLIVPIYSVLRPRAQQPMCVILITIWIIQTVELE